MAITKTPIIMTAKEFTTVIKNNETLKEGIVVEGNVSLSYTREINLPNNLTINGNLYITDSLLTYIPRGLKCCSLDISLCKNITTLPPDIEVDNLYANSSSLTNIPQGFKCKVLNISFCKNITSLPVGIEVKKLYAYNSSLTDIPRGLTLEELDIRNTNIAELTDGLVVTHRFWFGPNPIENVPKNFNPEKIWFLEQQLKK